MKVGLTLSKPEGLPWVRIARETLLKRDVQVALSDDVALALGEMPACETADAYFKDMDLAMVFGGDGTILHAARLTAPYDVPILGVNFGHLGFLPEIQPGEIRGAIDAFLRGDAFFENRMMLEAAAENGVSCLALNDISIVREADAGILRAKVFVGGQYLDEFAADGVLVSTPTGSTAYALSCGGPIISPSVDCMALLAICPHSLRSRPVILPASERIDIELSSPRARVLHDGKTCGFIGGDARVSIRGATCVARFLRLTRRNYYELLQKKLTEWS